ncbi:hypothetical protein [Pseudonocardia sp. Ae263_Ps1]|uniref:hypothetical protein n=1 Tax=Pseudonocardia sp. Ae263_Ps1 TaxID=1885030 RepID=UPI0009F8C004|nr:hypothetical protein [Pseudonocardia sp. Ae263_Ps1]
MVLDDYKLTVVEPPAPKTRRDGDRTEVPETEPDGTPQFMVSLFAKLTVRTDQRAPKGEEITVTLTSDPGDGFPEDTRVRLIAPKVTLHSVDAPDGRTKPTLEFTATGLELAHLAPAQTRQGQPRRALADA